jgi:hypothetical protein
LEERSRREGGGRKEKDEGKETEPAEAKIMRRV